MDYALEITGKDIAQIQTARALIPQGAEINIAFLGNETHAQRIEAARIIRECGFAPVPIISSRRLVSQGDADALVGGYRDAAAPQRLMIVGGDPAQPAGPYFDALALLGSGLLARHAITRVKLPAYPEGHPAIPTAKLWDALRWKRDFLTARGIEYEITTQFGFDAEAIAGWLSALRAEGIDCLVRIGIPGPTSAGKLLRFARQFGIGASTQILRRYGISLANLLHPVGPDRFLDRLNAAMADQDLGRVGVHLYPFGGITEGAIWMNEALARGQVLAPVPPR